MDVIRKRQTKEEEEIMCNWKKKPKAMKIKIARFAQKHYSRDAKKIREFKA